MSTTGDSGDYVIRPVSELSEELKTHLIRQLNGHKTPRETLALWYGFCRAAEILREAESILEEDDVPEYTRIMEAGRRYVARVVIRDMHKGVFGDE